MLKLKFSFVGFGLSWVAVQTWWCNILEHIEGDLDHYLRGEQKHVRVRETVLVQIKRSCSKMTLPGDHDSL